MADDARAGLPRSTPSAEGVDARGIDAFVTAVENAPGIEPHSLMVVKHGRVVAEGWWAPYAPDRVHLLYSLSKTFTSTALGFAIDEGLASLDDTVAQHFPEFADELPEASRRIRIRDVAAMASGHRDEQLEKALATDAAEPVRGFLLNPPEEETGVWFAYDQPCTYSVAAIVQRESGTSLVDYLRPRLFDPLGIGPVAWQEYPAGRNIGFSGLHARTEDVAKLGLAHLQDGRFGEAQVLPEGWAAEVRTKRVENPREENADWHQGYGFQVWMSRHGYRGDGAYGQFCLILPEQDAVIAITSATELMQQELDLVWEHLLPALDGEPASADVEDALAERLRTLALPPVTGDAAPTDAATGTRRAPDAVGLVEAVELAREGDTWTIALRGPAGSITAPIGEGEWRVTEDAEQPPVAVSGAARSDGSLRVDVILLETPHRLEVRFDADGGAAATWATTPLVSGRPTDLLSLRAPW